MAADARLNEALDTDSDTFKSGTEVPRGLKPAPRGADLKSALGFSPASEGGFFHCPVSARCYSEAFSANVLYKPAIPADCVSPG